MALGIASRIRKNMLYSLRFAMLLAMLTVAVVAIVTITLFAGLTTRVEFSRYLAFAGAMQEERLQEAVFTYWNFKFQDANQSLLIQPPRADMMPMAALPSDGIEYVVLRPPNGDWTIRTTQPNQVQFVAAPDGSVDVLDDGAKVGTLSIAPTDQLALIPAQIEFVQSVNWALLLAAGMAGVAAVFLTLILSRRILLPVAALTRAARKMESGDLTQRVEAAAHGEIGQLAHAFNAMAETLNRNEKLRRNMVSDIAHELRTPVTNIRGYLEALQDGVVQPDSSTIDMLYEEALLLNNIIQDLQELALAEAGQIRFNHQSVALPDVVTQTVSVLQPSASERGVSLRAELPARMPHVYADQKRIGQVLRNLINNAITHTPENGRVVVSACVREGFVEVRITDTGEGISAEHLPFIFERFYRVDQARSRTTGGAGLGLAIVRRLVETQGGQVWAESMLEAGSTFYFTLPIYEAKAAPQPAI
jgi:signal transduction histidine kinase